MRFEWTAAPFPRFSVRDWSVTASAARQMVDEMSVAKINELAHYKAGDKVEVTVSGGNPLQVIYRRKL